MASANIKITGATTLDELGVELAKLGVDYARAWVRPSKERPYMVAVGRIGLESIGTATTLAEAFDDAVSRFIHRTAARDLGARMGKDS